MPGSEPPPDRKSDRPSQRPGGSASLLGTLVGERYRVDSILGEGGMGTVYAAEHTLMRKRVALKVLHPDMGRNPDMVARFEREAMAAGHIDHPNIAAATDFGQLPDGSFFLVLEFVEGENLRPVIARGHLAVDRVIHIGSQIANALARAHALGVVHRDLKPDNVMLITRNGDPDFVKVLDFGIAKVPVLELGAKPPPSSVGGPPPESASPRVVTQIGMIYGTPEYMAPEQALGQAVDSRADLYAVGILLYEMLTGKRPFDHDNLATLLGMQVTAKVPPMAERAPEVVVPAALEAIVRRLLAKDPSQRFATAGELAQALDEARLVTLPTEPLGKIVSLPSSQLAREGSSAHVPTPALSPDALPKWVWALVGVGTLAVLGFALTSVLLLRGHAASVSALPDAGGMATTTAASDPVTALLATANEALERNDFATAIATVAPLEPTNENRADVHRVLEHAYAIAHNWPLALHEADRWLALDPSAVMDLRLQGDIGAAATQPDDSKAAIALLANKLGAPGFDILYDLAYGPQPPWLTERALAALSQPDVKAHAGPAAAILVELRAAKTCKARHALLPRVSTSGDRRALAILEPLAATTGCGFLKRNDCNPCLHHGSELADTIAAVGSGRAGLL